MAHVRRFYGQFQPPTDEIIASYFPSCRGTAVEVGAVDGVYLSNTLYFELNGWDVLCIEPNPAYASALMRNRKRTLLVAAGNVCADAVPFTVVTLAGGEQSAISGLKIDQCLLSSHRAFSPTSQIVSVPVRTLDWCLERRDIDKVDFITIDTEGTEIDVLKGFDLDRWKPALLVVECNSLSHEWGVDKYLAGRGYVLDRRHFVNRFYVPQNKEK